MQAMWLDWAALGRVSISHRIGNDLSLLQLSIVKALKKPSFRQALCSPSPAAMKKGRKPGHKEKLLVTKRPLEEKDFPGSFPEEVLRNLSKGLDVVALKNLSKVNQCTAHIALHEINKIVDEQARAMAKHARRNHGRNAWPRAIPYPFPALCFSCGNTIFAPHLYVKHPKRRGKFFLSDRMYA